MEHNSQWIKTCTHYLTPHNGNNILNHRPIIQIRMLCVVCGCKLITPRWIHIPLGEKVQVSSTNNVEGHKSPILSYIVQWKTLQSRA